LECENGTDAAEREQRLLADFAEPQGRKACAAGLKRKAENFFVAQFYKRLLKVVREFNEIRENSIR